MKKGQILLVTAFLGCVICLLFGSRGLYNYYSWADEKTMSFPPKAIPVNDTLQVIMIGDSWAAYHDYYDSMMTRMLQEKLQKPVSVTSSGMVGAKTKTIYEKMFDSISPIGTQKLIAKQPGYCIISAGINDAVAKMGTSNYCHHYGFIIKNLLSAGIKPIVLDMPDVDYNAVYQRESFISKIRHRLSSWFTNAPLWSFEEYRKALFHMINQENIKNDIIYIPATDWNPKGFGDPRELYAEDHIHLNKKGYQILDSCITSYIYRDFTSSHDSQ